MIDQLAKNLPDPLLQMPRFLLWKAEPGPKGKTAKVPYFASGQRRKGRLDTPEDLAQLVSFEEALEAYKLGGYAGIGFALTGDGIGAFDLDHILDEVGDLIVGHPGFELVKEAKAKGAYIEISPSNAGLRIVGPCQSQKAYSKGGLEYWGRSRFVTTTGNVWANPGAWVALDDLRDPLGVDTAPVGDDGDDDGPLITPRTIEELRSALEAVPSDERDLWIRMGMALKTAGPKGNALWLDWSKKSAKFDAADAERVWASLDPKDTNHRAVFAEAKRHGWQNPRGKKHEADEASEVDDDIDLGDKPEFRPTEFVLDGFLPVGVSVIAGAWGAGKSTNLIPLLASVAHLAPESWGFWPDLRRHIVWITEAPEQAHDTLLSLHRADGAAPWREFRQWFHLQPSRRKPAKAVAGSVRALVDQHTWTTDNGFDVKPVVVLDTTTANIDLENENDNAQVGAAMAALKQALRGCPLVLVGHTPKAMVRADVTDMTFRGAGAWEAEAAATYFLVWDQETDMRFLAIRKARFTPAYREIDFDHESGSVILPTPWGEPQSKHYLHGVPTKSNGEARKAARQELIEERKEEAKARTRTERQERIVAFVRQCSADGRLATRAAIREELGGKKGLLLAAVNELIEAELITSHAVSKDQLEAFGLSPKPPFPDVLLPTEVSFDAFCQRAVKGNQHED